MDGMNDRKRSLLRVFDVLRMEGDMTQSRLKDTLQLRSSTVSYLVSDLKKLGVIVNSGETLHSEGRGKPGRLLQLNHDRAQFIGLYIEAQRVHCHVVGLDGQVIDQQVAEVPQAGAMEEWTVRIMDELIDRFSAIRGIGIAMKGLVLDQDQLLFGRRPGVAAETWGIEGFLGRLRERYDTIPILLENDANCVALLHQHQQQRTDMDLILYLLNESPFGIGCAILQQGILTRGARGGAGQYFEKDSRFALAEAVAGRDHWSPEVFVGAMMHHVAMAAYLLDPEEIILAGSLFEGQRDYSQSVLADLIRSWGLPMPVKIRSEDSLFNPGMGAALIATNRFVLETIEKVGAR